MLCFDHHQKLPNCGNMKKEKEDEVLEMVLSCNWGDEALVGGCSVKVCRPDNDRDSCERVRGSRNICIFDAIEGRVYLSVWRVDAVLAHTFEEGRPKSR